MLDGRQDASALPRATVARFPPWSRPLLIRSLRRSDERACRAFGSRLTADDLRLRFASPVRTDDRLCQRLIDAGQSPGTVLVAIEDDDVVGIGRLAPTSAVEAEFALIVRSDLKGRGIGSHLLAALIDRARDEGYRCVSGDILHENRRMRDLAASFGFRYSGQSGSMLSVRLVLNAAITHVQQPYLFPW